jgi:hypothetical protein
MRFGGGVQVPVIPPETTNVRIVKCGVVRFVSGVVACGGCLPDA